MVDLNWAQPSRLTMRYVKAWLASAAAASLCMVAGILATVVSVAPPVDLHLAMMSDITVMLAAFAIVVTIVLALISGAVLAIGMAVIEPRLPSARRAETWMIGAVVVSLPWMTLAHWSGFLTTAPSNLLAPLLISISAALAGYAGWLARGRDSNKTSSPRP